MNAATTTMTVLIPDASASRSKMQKKGWKCWAKELSHVNDPANDGYAFEGEFCEVGSSRECEPGAVILHVDQSSSATIGVVYPNMKGAGRIYWLADAGSDGRKWCGPLGKPARRLLGMAPADRVAEVARKLLEEGPSSDATDREAFRAYYQGLADGPRPQDPTAIAIEDARDRANPLAAYTDDQIRAEFVRRGLAI